MENQNILIGIGVLILFIVIVFALITISLVHFQKPIEKPKPESIKPVKEPIHERLYREVEKIRRYDSNFYSNNYLIILNKESYSELSRFVRSHYNYNPWGMERFLEFEIKVHRKLEQDILILEKETKN